MSEHNNNNNDDDKPNDITSPAQNLAEIAIERAKLRDEAKDAELDAAYGTHPKAETTRNNLQENQSDWEYLRSIAKTEFPEGKDIAGLSPDNRLVAIAHCLGWNDGRIADASKKSRTTIGKWLKRPDIKLFINEFNMKRGEGVDVMTKFSALEYKGIKCIERILDDPSNEDSVRRLQADATKWVFERNRGKADQKIEVRGSAIKQFINVMSQTGKNFSIDEKEEEELFNNDSDETH